MIIMIVTMLLLISFAMAEGEFHVVPKITSNATTNHPFLTSFATLLLRDKCFLDLQSRRYSLSSSPICDGSRYLTHVAITLIGSLVSRGICIPVLVYQALLETPDNAPSTPPRQAPRLQKKSKKVRDLCI